MAQIGQVMSGVSLFSPEDVYLFREGNQARLYDKMGAHLITHDGIAGTYFAVWAPNAKSVSVIGNFNQWNDQAHPLSIRDDASGIWEGFIPGIGSGEVYKYHIVSQHNDYRTDKTDPFAFFSEVPPQTASVVWGLDYQWQDARWMRNRRKKNASGAPISIYEIHFGSWRKRHEEHNCSLTYREMASELIRYLKDMGYTHVEFLPLMEHPFYGSWGYQIIGYFAATSRYGTPQELMYLIDKLHENGFGVIFDWVPSHFVSDGHGLVYFDGTHLYEHADRRKGFHPDWKSYIFNYGRTEVRSFLISSALFWFDKYHIDGLRVDAVASMLYLDYSRNNGEWVPNRYGGRENIEAIDFLRRLNEVVYEKYPDVQMIAEESTAWPLVSRPTSDGGLGFGMKWNMGWMHDTLAYFSQDPLYRKHHHGELTFSMLYAFTENFMLPFSHDEVVHGKGSLVNKMPGDDWQKFANMRLLYGYMYGHPGKKLMFMGQEFGQRAEWNHEKELEWYVLEYAPHRDLQRWVRELNAFYKNEPALYENDFHHEGFQWIDCHDWQRSVLSFIRKPLSESPPILVVCNFTPVPHSGYTLRVPCGGYWKEMLNSDAKEYGGSGQGNLGGVESSVEPLPGGHYSLSITVPPLAAVFFKYQPKTSCE
ncbi:MAG: 1,4-alpha-glucan branching protein GlgB [Candidatus Omnitrophica bacterium]|nr:1,4-alpha-glucan branching protein GlgB [Candidatus Omnitrophota bacterium]